MKTAMEIRDAIRDGKMTAVEALENSLKVIKEKNDDLFAFVEVFEEDARKAAQAIDGMKAEGKELPRLAGIPVAIKDNMLYQGHTVTSGSNILKEYVAGYNSTVVQRLIDAGAIIVGRTNMDDAAMGSSTETSVHGITKNPWNDDVVPGGSSGGSAVAVASGMVPFALGSDTGGSIRQPAALCGIVGMKPSYGHVSRYGLIAFASSLDQIGPLATTVADAALLLEVIEGRDEMDATTLDLKQTTTAELLETSFEGMKIGVAKQFFAEGLDESVKEKTQEAIELMKVNGAEIVEVDFTLMKYSLPTYYILNPAEASSNLARLDGMRYGTRAEGALMESYKTARGLGFGREVKRRIILGTHILSAGYYDAYYKKALAVRTAIKDELNEVMKSVDVLVTPTTTTTAWKFGEKMDDPLAMYLADIYTVSANIAGTPGISVPSGMIDGLPVGLQFLAGSGQDHKVFKAAAAYEKLVDWPQVAK